MPDKDKIQQSLFDFDATIKAKPNLSDKELMGKFPEFGNDINKLQAAKDYSATLNSGKYKDASEFNSKFPEFFGEELKKKEPTPSPSLVTQLPSAVNPLQKGASILSGKVLGDVSKGIKQSVNTIPSKKEEQGWLLNTVSALDKGFYKNLVGNPIKGIGTLLQQGTRKIIGGTGEGFISDALIKFGDSFNNAIDELTPQDESFKNTLTDQFAQAFGQVGSMVATAGIGGGISKGASAASQLAPKAVGTSAALKGIGSQLANPSAVSAGLVMGQSEFDKAKQLGATDDQAFEAFYKNAVVGSVLENIPVMQFMKRFNQSTGGGVANYIKTKGVAGITGGLEEMTTEVLQQLYANKTAKDIYNTNQNLFEGLTENGGIGFGVGFLLNAMGAKAKLLKKQGNVSEAKLIENQVKEFEKKSELKPSSDNNTVATKIAVLGKESGAESSLVNLQKDFENGVIDENQYNEGVKFIEKAAAIDDTIPQEIKGENRATSIELINERQRIEEELTVKEEQKKQVDVAFHKPLDEANKELVKRMDEINKELGELAKPKNKITKIDGISFDEYGESNLIKVPDVPKDFGQIRVKESNNGYFVTVEFSGEDIFMGKPAYFTQSANIDFGNTGESKYFKTPKEAIDYAFKVIKEKYNSQINNESPPKVEIPTTETVSEVKPTEEESKTGLVLYHGSPHSFENFDITKLGSGEGQQAFGNGLYFTNEEGIAKGYANKLGSKKNFWEALQNGHELSLTKDDFDFIKNELDALGFDGAKAENEGLEGVLVDGKSEYAPDVLDAMAILFGKDARKELEGFDLSESQINRLLEIKKKISDPQLYKVALHEGKSPSEYNYLEWRDKLTDAQREKIGKGLPENISGEEAYKLLSKELGSDKKASEYLLSKGIDGITYKSEKGTGGKTGEGRNYVVFDPKSIRIDEINNNKQTPTELPSVKEEGEKPIVTIPIKLEDKTIDAEFVADYGGKKVVKIDGNIHVYDPKKETVFNVALDDSNGKKRTINQEANNLEAAKKYIDWANEANKENVKPLELTPKEEIKVEEVKPIKEETITETETSGEENQKPKQKVEGNEPPKAEKPKKEDLGTKARSLAEQLRKGDKNVLPDWLKADLPKGTKLQGIDINEAFANALDTFADVYDKAKDFAKAVEEGFKHIKNYFDENNIDYNEVELKEKFASQFKEQKELDEQRRFTARMLATEGLLPISEIAKTLDYVKQKNEMSIDEANDIIKKAGLDEAFNLVKDSRDMNGGVRSVLGQSLISRYNNLARIATEEGEKEFYWDKTIEVANYVTEKLATDAGQQIQAFSLWSKLSPEAQIRNVQKDMKRQGEFAKKKAKKDSDAIAKKLIKANEEAVNEVLESKELQAELGKAETKQKSKATDKIKKAQDKRKAIIEKYKNNNKGGITLSSGGLTTEGIEFVGEVAKTYIEEGIANLELIVEKIIADFKTISGKDADENIVKQIKEIADKKLSSSDNKLLSKGMADMKIKISEIVKQHYTKVDYTKKKLSDKLVGEAGLEGEEAIALAEKISAAFDRVASKKKLQILEQETNRLEKAREKLKGTKQPTIKQLHDAILKYTNLGGFGNEEILDLLAEKVGTGQLTLEEGKKLQELAEKVRVAPDGSPKNDAIQELLNYQATLKGVKTGELSQAVWYASLLAGYKTHIKNIVANAANTFAETFVQSVQNPLASPFLIKGLLSGYKRGLIEALHTLKTGKSPIHISKIEASNVLERKSFKGGAFNPFNYLKYVGRAMVAADVFAFQGLKESRSYQLAYMEASKMDAKNLFAKEYWDMKSPLDKKVWEKVNAKLFNTKQRYEDAMQIVKFEGLKGNEAKRRVFEIMEQTRDFKMTENAYNYAARGTFNYNPEGILGALNNRLSVLLDTEFGSTKALRYIVPFTRILTNVANEALNYEPIIGTRRAIRGKVGLESFKNTSITKDAYREMTPEERRTQITKAAIGISTMAILYALSKYRDDKDEPLIEITGGGSIDFNKTNQLKERGWQPYSIKIGDTYYSYKLTPLILSLGYIGNLNDYEKYDSKGKLDMIDKMSQTAFRTSDALADMTWVSSTADFMSDFFKQGDASKGKKVQQWLENQVKTAIPFMQPYTQISQGIQDVLNTPQKETSQLGANLIKDIPIARTNLYDKINVLGEPIHKSNAVIYSNKKQDKDDKVWDFLEKNNVFITPIKRQSVVIWDDKQKMERPLTMKEFYDYSKLRGELIKKSVIQLMEDGIVEINLENGEKITRKVNKAEAPKEIQNIVDEKTKEAKSKLFSEKPVEIPKKVTFPASIFKQQTGGSY